MDIPNELLRTFVAAADTANFTQTAAIVHRTQSAVSMQMKRLEEDLEQPLFERNGRSMKLTGSGEAFLPYARRILKLHDEALTEIRRPEMNGRVRLGAPYDYAEQVLPQVLARFAATWPLVQVDVVFDRSTRLKAALDDGQLDLIILSDIDIAQRGERVYRDQVVWITSALHIIHESDPLPLAAYHEECSFRFVATKALEGIGREYRIAYTSPSITGILAAVKSGLAVATIERSAVPSGIRILTPEEGFPELPMATISLITARGKQTPLVKALAHYVTERFRDMDTPA